MSDPTIQVLPKGPYLVTGKFLPSRRHRQTDSGRRENCPLPLRRFHQQTILRRNAYQGRLRRSRRSGPRQRGVSWD